MRGLRKYLTPFAPDQSGAVSVLYELGGIIVICDAGGCAGNVCGFDEPRWFEQKSGIWMPSWDGMTAWLPSLWMQQKSWRQALQLLSEHRYLL